MTNLNYHGGTALADAVKKAYQTGQIDYSLSPLSLYQNGSAVGKIKDGDSVIFCCRRGEREIELTDFFVDPNFDKVERQQLHNLNFVIMTMYHEKYKSLPIAFGASHVTMPLAEVLSQAGKTQFHCSESEKFAHVTFFFNGGNPGAYPGETDTCIPSIKGIPFEQKPELSLAGVADKVIDSLGKYDFIVTNFANGDVIGHTSNDKAKIKAAEYISHHLGRVVEAAKKAGYVIAITADHGNIEVLHTPTGKPHVAHTTNLVSFIMIDPANPNAVVKLHNGALSDVAPTVLGVMGIPKPAEMTGASLAEGHDFGKNRKMILIICDGWGQGDKTDNDAIFLADTPYWDQLLEKEANSLLNASGPFVGLEEGKPGNSEAGHSNLGAGRCVPQDDVRMDAAIKDGSFSQNPAILKAIEDAIIKGTSLHLLSLLTHKSSHGSIDYPLAICEMAKSKGLSRVYLHIIFDGRSTEPGSAPELLTWLDGELNKRGIGLIVDGVGRGIALDRDNNFSKVKLAYDNLIIGSGIHYE